MPKIIYITPNGQEYSVDTPEGHSVMEAAVANDVPGISADCGGACTCATCHVYVDEAWYDRLPTPDEMEAAMLEFAETEMRATSRLSCQVKITAALDGLIVRLPQ
jgi:2Fe-2S ferredoxin